MLTEFQALILGIIEGVTEFLPVSSTGHLILSSQLLKIEQTDFVKSFEITIQLGAILSVLILYWKKLFFDAKTFKKVTLAFLPTAAAGLAFYELIKTYLIGNSNVVLWSLFLGGVFLIIFELFHKEKTGINDISKISYGQSFLIGFFQAVSIIPGVSRAAATIIGGLALGVNRAAVVEFSFLLAIPTMLAATGFDLLKNAGSFSPDQFYILGLGFAVSFFSAMLAIRFLLSFIKKHSFVSFGVYRIILVLVFWLLLT